jgi:hypothetical protein
MRPLSGDCYLTMPASLRVLYVRNLSEAPREERTQPSYQASKGARSHLGSGELGTGIASEETAVRRGNIALVADSIFLRLDRRNSLSPYGADCRLRARPIVATTFAPGLSAFGLALVPWRCSRRMRSKVLDRSVDAAFRYLKPGSRMLLKVIALSPDECLQVRYLFERRAGNSSR